MRTKPSSGHSSSVPDGELMVNEARAAVIAGFNVRRLRAWAGRGIVSPSVQRELSARNTVRLYGFAELVELKVARSLLDEGRSPQQIRKVVHHLRQRDYRAPLRELRFAVAGDRIYFQHPDGTWEGDANPDQIVLHTVLDLERIRGLVRQAVRAPRRAAGSLEKRRGIVGSKLAFAGTRVPLAAVEPYVRRGFSDEQILAAFPLLTAEDLETARAALPAA